MNKIFNILIFIFLNITLQASDYPHLAVDKIDKSLLKNANAVIRYDINEVKILSYKKLEFFESVAITVLNENASYLLDFRKYYTENASKLVDIELKYLDENGDVVSKIKRSDIQDLNAHDSSLASSSKHRYYDFTPKSYPITIVYSLTHKSSNTCFIPNWSPVGMYKVSVESSSYKLINETDITINYLESNFDKFNVVNEMPFEYLLENTKIIKTEKYMPSLFNIIPKVEFSLAHFNYQGVEGEADDWTKYGEWMYREFLNDRESFDKEKVKNELLKFIDDPDDKIEVAKTIYKFVQKNTRYISIQLEEGGFKPMSSKQVNKLKYGDCKGLSFYTINLLKLFDIDANYVKVYAGVENQKSFYKDFFSHQQSNHVILNIPFEDGYIWLDATSEFNPFNYLGFFTDNRYVLSVNKNETKVIKTPNYGAKFNNDIIHGKVMLDKDGHINSTYSHDYIGKNYASLKYVSHLEPIKYKKKYAEGDLSDFQKLDLKSVEFEFEEDKILAREKIEFSANSYGEKLGDYLSVPSALLSFSVPKFKKTKKRKYPIVFKRSKKQESYVTYTLPKDIVYSIKNDTVKYEGKYGTYLREIKKEDDNITVKRIFELHEGYYEKSEYADIRSFFNKIRKKEQSLINIKTRT